MPATILVTGAAGFVGRHATAALARAGHRVHGVARRGPPADAALVDNIPADNVRWHAADLLDPAARRALLEATRPDYLLHLAWTTEHGRFWTAPDNLDWVGATLDLARRFAENGGRRMVAAGTCVEYDPPADGPCHEATTPLRPATLYGVAKDACRRTLTAYAAQTGLSLGWGRLFFLYGPAENPRRLVPSVLRDLLAGREAACGSGRARRDFIDARDAGAAFAALLLSEAQGAVNIASGHSATIADVAQRLGTLAGRPELIRLGARPDPAGEPPCLTADISRLRDEAGFTPTHDLDSGLRDCLAYWRQAEAGGTGGGQAG